MQQIQVQPDLPALKVIREYKVLLASLVQLGQQGLREAKVYRVVRVLLALQDLLVRKAFKDLPV